MAHFKAFVLPTLTISIPLYAGYMRVLRSDMIGTLQNDFITTARAKGVGTGQLLFKHTLRPSLFSIVTSAAVNIGALMGGVVIVEQFFLLNGMGRLTVESIFHRRVPHRAVHGGHPRPHLCLHQLLRRPRVRLDRPESPCQPGTGVTP